MRVLTVPGRLRAAVLVLGLSVPIAALETIVVAKAPWWRLPWRSIQLWSAVVAFIVLPLGGWIAAGRSWAAVAVVAFGAFWCAASAWVAIRMEYPGLGYFTVLLCCYWYGTASWIRTELGRSFFDPRMRWYEGLPRPIPGLSCLLGGVQARVSRFDPEGAFVYVDRGGLDAIKAAQPLDVVFGFKEKEVRCSALPVRTLGTEDGATVGAGLQFLGLSPDGRKELGDFVETLRGEGHVS